LCAESTSIIITFNILKNVLKLENILNKDPMKPKTVKILLLLSILIITSCLCHKRDVKSRKLAFIIPVGTVQIDSNFFVDKTEIRNLDYLEYLFWTKRIYGINSTTYKNALPDTTVWEDSTGYLKMEYLRMPLYKDFPVVGVSYKQAMDYSKWRSDWVFQLLLVSKELIDLNMQEDSSNCFTIDRYFKGQYKNYKPDMNFLYPEYTLPTNAEWNLILAKSDSVNNKKVYTMPVNSDTKDQVIFHLRDNVSEISKNMGYSLGNNWKFNKGMEGDGINIFTSPNSWTGFRNVCQWKKYNAN
jgi:hypothetical protein